MGYMLPLTASFKFWRAERYVSRSALGVEVAGEWKVEHGRLGAFDTPHWQDGYGLTWCESRSELAVLLTMKLLLYAPVERGK